jgi:hypothetical protein
VAALVIFPRRLWLFFQGGSGYFPGVACFSGGSGYFPRLWLFSRGGLFSGGSGYFPWWPVFFLRLWLFPRGGNSNYTVLDIFLLL